jgi:uncharacterized membrane protein (DUF441 family)
VATHVPVAVDKKVPFLHENGLKVSVVVEGTGVLVPVY